MRKVLLFPSPILVLWFLLLAATYACDEESCVDGGREYQSGDKWTCSDGCNSCECIGGDISSTMMQCPEPPGEKEGKLMCDSHFHGSSWPCSDGCGWCKCDDGKTVEDLTKCHQLAATN